MKILKMLGVIILTGAGLCNLLGQCFTFSFANCAAKFQNQYYTCPNVTNIKSVVGTGDQSIYKCVPAAQGASGSLGCTPSTQIICKVKVVTTYCDGTTTPTEYGLPVNQNMDDGQGPCPAS